MRDIVLQNFITCIDSYKHYHNQDIDLFHQSTLYFEKTFLVLQTSSAGRTLINDDFLLCFSLELSILRLRCASHVEREVHFSGWVPVLFILYYMPSPE